MITNAIGPVGSREAPQFVIDSDAINPDPGYNRNILNGSVTVTFSGPGTADYRIIADLLDAADEVVPMVAPDLGTGTMVSDTFTLSLAGALPFATRTRSFEFEPDVDLGAGDEYRIRYVVQESVTDSNGQQTWIDVSPSEDTIPFVVIHFRDNPVEADTRYVRGYELDDPSWVKVDALQTSNVLVNRSFQVTMPVRLWRYDRNSPSSTVNVRYTAEMRDDLGNVIPLEDGGVQSDSIELPALTVGAPDAPAVIDLNHVINLRPTLQLNARSRTYQVRLKFEHLEFPATTTYRDNGTSDDSPLQRLLHFNGNLRIASGIDELNAVFSAYSNNPPVGSLGANFVNSVVNVTNGSFPGFPDYSFGDGSAINVRVFNNGDAEATSISQPLQVSGGDDVEADFGGVRVFYPGVMLTTGGAVAGEARVRLPQGLSYTPGRNASAGRFLPDFVVSGPVQLTGQFRHSGDLSQATSADAWIFDESRTLLYKTTHFLMTDDGEIRFTTPDAEWVHKQGWEMLENDSANGLHAAPGMELRKSNEGYLRHAMVAATPSTTTIFTAAGDGTARCKQADLLLDPVEFTTHFPAGVELAMAGVGELRIRDGAVSDDSFLDDVSPFFMSYDRACTSDVCAPAASTATATFLMAVTGGDLQLTPDGGIHGHVTLPPSELRWGLRANGSVAHRTDEFDAAEFLAPGNQLYRAENPLAAGGPLMSRSAVLGPSVILNAGFDADGAEEPVYFGTPGYINGVGAWPGATFTAAGSLQGASRLGDMSSDYLYDLLEEVSKYYIRPSGLSGRHVAVEPLLTSEIQIYDYQFALTSFQLTFLSNVNRDSWVNGEVEVPFPSDFTQKFTNLKLTCVGALDDAQIDPSDMGEKPLRYWNGSFLPMAMVFVPEDETCYADRRLALGLVSGAANIDVPLAGSLGFMSDGNIATPAVGLPGVDGRLGLPANVPMDGPGDGKYILNPVTKLYFNHYDIDESERPPSGFVSFAATCNVPFFKDLEVHVMTSAQTDVPAPLFLAGGWQDGGQTFFSNTLFDSENRGFPEGVALGDYRDPSEENAYVVSASQSIFGIVDITYPLRWNANARFFQSWTPQEDDLLVLQVEHQIDYLSAENAEITFGVQYDGMPKLNLVGAAFDAVDEQLGAARAITAAAQGFVTDMLNQGVDEIGNLVNDNIDRLLDEALGVIDNDVIGELYGAMVTSYENAAGLNQSYNDWVTDSSVGLQAVFDFYFDPASGTADTFINYLNQLSDVAGEASSLIARIDRAVEQGILAIDAVAGQINVIQNSEVVLEIPVGIDPQDIDILPGILALVDIGGGTMERQIVQNLIAELIRELASPDVAAIINPLLADVSSDLNERLQKLLEKYDPTLTRITEVLLQAREYLVVVRQKLEFGGQIVTAFDQIVNNASDELENIVAAVRETAETFIDNMATALASPFDAPLEEIGGLLDEFSPEAFKLMIRNELRDRLLVSDFIQQVQYCLRQYISELDMALRSAIDSAFAEVSRMCKELIKEALGPIDDKINGLLGDVNSVVGAGSVDGYAHIQGDTLRRLRLDAEVELKVPDEMKLQAYLEMLCYDSSTTTGTSGASPCVAEGEKVVEVRIGALDVPLDWISPDMRADLGVWFSMKIEPQVRPRGLGGSLTMTGGELNFQSFKVTEFSAAVALGAQENYLAASATVIVSDYQAAGGIFFGRTCSIEPLRLVDPDAASLLGQPPFTGAYVYGEVWLPISEMLFGIPATCLFRISASVGAGAFYFAEGPTYGGRMSLGASGEALCIVSIEGQISLIAVMAGGDLRFSGRGTVSGEAGICPICTEISRSLRVTYQDGSWSLD